MYYYPFLHLLPDILRPEIHEEQGWQIQNDTQNDSAHGIQNMAKSTSNSLFTMYRGDVIDELRMVESAATTC